MPVNLHHLHVLEKVYHEHSITKAARALQLTQPAVSSILKQLQSHFSVPLLDISHRRVELTKAGEILLHANRDITRRLHAALNEIQAIEGCVKGDLVIAMVSSAEFFIPRLVGKFLNTHEQVQVHLDSLPRCQVIHALQEHRCDFAILSASAPIRPFHCTAFKDNPLVIVASPQHPLAKRPCLTWDEIKYSRWLVRETSSSLRMALDEMFHRSHLKQPDIVMELASTGAMTQAACAHLGIALVPQVAVELELAHGKLVTLPVEGFPLIHRWYAVSPRDKQQIPVAEAFIASLKEA